MTHKTGRGHFLRIPRFYSLVPEEQIDDAETLKRFGYRAVNLPPSSSKKVVCSCSACKKILERVRIRVRAPVLCHSCSKSKMDYGDPSTLIDEEQTQREFNYSVKNLPRYSLNTVVGICTSCRIRFHVRMRSVKPEQKCPSCRKISSCAERLRPRENDGRKLLNDAETQNRFGYLATALSPKSFKMAVATCPCGSVYQRIRRNINDNSTCIGCSRKKIDHKALQNKRKKKIILLDQRAINKKIEKTLSTRYPDRRVIGKKVQQTIISRYPNREKFLKEVLNKRQQTLLARYPDGIPCPTHFGKTATDLGDFLAEKLGRPLSREVFLSNGQRIDLFDPQTKTGIEYCGLYWHNEHSLTPRVRRYHMDKMLAAQKDGYRLITVFEDEYLEREEAVKNRLLVILGNSRIVVQARKCSLELIDPVTAREFIEKHHIQGCPPAFKYAIGILMGAELLGMMLGGNHHRQGHKQELVLSRLCFAPQVHITGGTRRLFKKLCSLGREEGYQKIITWSDRRWTDGEVYARLGMQLVEDLPPDYSYVNSSKPYKRFSKQSQQKRLTGCPPEVSEGDWAHQHGFSRIWDCGHQRWESRLLP